MASRYPKPYSYVLDKQGVSALERYVAKGGDIDLQESKNLCRTLLIFAVEKDKPLVVRWLLKNNVDVNLADSAGLTAIHYAARSANEEIASCLISKGVDVTKSNPGGLTPLHLLAMTPRAKETAKQAEFGLLELFVQSGAPINAEDNANRTPLFLAAGLGKTKLCLRMIELGARIELDARGITPIENAQRREHPRTVKTLLQLSKQASEKRRE